MGIIDNSNQQSMNPLLQKTEAAIEAKVTPDNKSAHDKIVAAGMKLAFSKASHDAVIQGLDQSKEPVHDIAVGVVGILLMLSQKAKGTMPVPPMVSAGMVLVLHGLDYIEKTKGIKITNTELDDATKLFITTLSPKIGLTPQVMAKVNQTAQGAMQNKQLMAEYTKRSGAQNGNV